MEVCRSPLMLGDARVQRSIGTNLGWRSGGPNMCLCIYVVQFTTTSLANFPCLHQESTERQEGM